MDAIEKAKRAKKRSNRGKTREFSHEEDWSGTVDEREDTVIEIVSTDCEFCGISLHDKPGMSRVFMTRTACVFCSKELEGIQRGEPAQGLNYHERTASVCLFRGGFLCLKEETK
jgi:hypothetical protein